MRKNNRLESKQMITSLQIKNYRCFEDVELKEKSIGRFNIVVGQNASGKTTLLEAINMTSGSFGLVFTYKYWRGLQMTLFARTNEEYKALWQDSFFRFDDKNPIEISLGGAPEYKRTFKMFYGKDTLEVLLKRNPLNQLSQNQITPDSFTMIPLTFEVEAGGKKYVTRPQIQPDSGSIISTTNEVPPVSKVNYVPSFLPMVSGYSVSLYSNISRRNKEDEIKLALKEVFPQIKDLSVLGIGNVPAIYCSLPESFSEKVPVSMVSSGIYKLLYILLVIASEEAKVVLIDELENGFHYSILPKVWKLILDFCGKFNVQLFASTHSKECLEALKPSIDKDEDSFRLLRVEKSEDEKKGHVVKAFGGSQLAAALETGVEFR
jgi:AAA15 family ATPase/GTPase